MSKKTWNLLLRLACLLLIGGLLSGCMVGETSSRREITSAAPAASETAAPSQAEPAASSQTETIATVEPQTCFTYDGLTVTATGLENSLLGSQLNLQIDNQSKSDYTVSCEAVIVNDCMITDLFSSTVAAGKQAITELDLLSSELEAAGIHGIGQIEVYFYVLNPSTYDRVYEADCVTIQTSQYGAVSEDPVTGTELYNANGVRILGQYVDENTFWGSSVLLYVENHSGRAVTVSADDLSVNGKMMTALFSATVYDGKKSFDNITLLSTELEKNGISKIQDVELKFQIWDANTYETIAESGAVSFQVSP